MKNKLKLLIIILWPFILLPLMGALTNTFDTSTPGGSDDPREADDRMREIKAAIQERMDNHNGYSGEGDQYWPLTGTEVSDTDTGQHRMVTLRQLSDDPDSLSSYGTLTDLGFVYQKDVSDNGELFYEDESSNAVQLTDNGTINLTSAALLGELANDTYFTAIDAAGTGTVDLIKADSNDVAVVPDNSQTATNAAPTSTTGIANKKYVDDQIAANPTPIGRLYLSSEQTDLTKDTWTTVELDSISSGFTDSIENTTSHKITPAVEGIYMLTGSAESNQFGSGSYAYSIRFLKNGSTTIAEQWSWSSTEADKAVTTSALVYLDDDDYIQLQFRHSKADNNQDITAGEHKTFLTLHRVR